MKRGFFDIFFILSLFILPWWINVIWAFIGIFIFKDFYEFVFSAIVLYSIYFIKDNSFFASPIYFFAIVFLTYIGIQILRHRIILYKNNDLPY